jgi:HSP20 family molecular chaperone IbpA
MTETSKRPRRRLPQRKHGGLSSAFAEKSIVCSRTSLAEIKVSFKKGVLTVTLPKTAEARRVERKTAVKAG